MPLPPPVSLDTTTAGPDGPRISGKGMEDQRCGAEEELPRMAAGAVDLGDGEIYGARCYQVFLNTTTGVCRHHHGRSGRPQNFRTGCGGYLEHGDGESAVRSGGRSWRSGCLQDRVRRVRRHCRQERLCEQEGGFFPWFPPFHPEVLSRKMPHSLAHRGWGQQRNAAAGDGEAAAAAAAAATAC